MKLHMLDSSELSGGIVNARRRGILCLAALLLALPILVISSHGAHASPRQACDPAYGCTTTSPPPTTPHFVCHAVFHGQAGGPQSVDVSGLPPGEVAKVYFNGAVYGTGTAGADGRVTIQFQVPAGTSGQVSVIAAGADFSVACDPSVTVHPASSGSPVGASGLLAHTGAGIGLLVAAALLLILAGEILRRQRRARRS